VAAVMHRRSAGAGNRHASSRDRSNRRPRKPTALTSRKPYDPNAPPVGGRSMTGSRRRSISTELLQRERDAFQRLRDICEWRLRSGIISRSSVQARTRVGPREKYVRTPIEPAMMSTIQAQDAGARGPLRVKMHARRAGAGPAVTPGRREGDAVRRAPACRDYSVFPPPPIEAGRAGAPRPRGGTDGVVHNVEAMTLDDWAASFRSRRAVRTDDREQDGITTPDTAVSSVRTSSLSSEPARLGSTASHAGS
jgi:hypothetical protein